MKQVFIERNEGMKKINEIHLHERMTILTWYLDRDGDLSGVDDWDSNWNPSLNGNWYMDREWVRNLLLYVYGNWKHNIDIW